MKQWKRLIFFLFLNILVSACTTLGILVIWDQTRAPLPGGLLQPIVLGFARAETPQPTQTPPEAVVQTTPTALFDIHIVQDGDTFDSIAEKYNVSVDDLIAANGYTQSQTLSPNELLRIPIRPAFIDSVIGVGDLNTERVVIVNNLPGELPLAGWQIENNSGSTFTFPDITLFTKEGVLRLNTKSGVDSTNDVYWGLQAPMWQSGMVVSLRDPQGKIQATYTIP